MLYVIKNYTYLVRNFDLYSQPGMSDFAKAALLIRTEGTAKCISLLVISLNVGMAYSSHFRSGLGTKLQAPAVSTIVIPMRIAYSLEIWLEKLKRGVLSM